MIARFKLWLRAWLVAWDQLAMVGTCFFTFVLLGRGKAPNEDETISSRVGRAAIRGKRWALVCEAVIDWIFARLGERGHCRNAVEWDEVRGLAGYGER